MYKSQECRLLDLGFIEYLEALRLQQRVVRDVAEGKAAHTLLACQHPPVITVSRRSRRENIVASDDDLRGLDVSVFCAHRGGDVTYHGPGQVVLYPIFDLNLMQRDLGLFVWKLEEALICALRDNFGLNALRRPEMRGVWVGPYKVASIGLGVRRWVTYHGVALNVRTDRRYFSMIRSCGSDVKMASLNDFFDDEVSMAEVQRMLLESFEDIFEVSITGGERHGQSLFA